MPEIVYAYGMKYRGFSPGAQPMKGLVDWREDPLQKYHNIIYYDHLLTGNEMFDYDLDYIGNFLNF